MADNKKTDRVELLKRMFNIGISNDGKLGMKNRIYPTRTITKDGKVQTVKEMLPPRVQQLFDYWMQSCHDNAASYENRKQLYQDMEMIYYNSPLISRAMNMVADEVVQADVNMRSISVEAKPKQKAFIEKMFDDLNIDKFLRPTAFNIIQFGDAGWIPVNDGNTMSEILPIDIYDLIDRIEFTPHEVKKELEDKASVLTKLSTLERVKALIDAVTSESDYASYFKSYLFGFQIGDFVLPPWRFIHFRNYTDKSPFAPFGIPYFIHAVAPYRQYDAAMALQVAARGAKFPLDVYKMNLPNVMSPVDKLDRVIEFISELDNSGLRDVKKEGIGIGERLITIADLFEYDQITPNIDLDKIDDIELLRDEIILATGLPRNFLDPNNGSFGNSGVSLMQQFKPFARAVFQIQSHLLDGIAQLIKINMIQSGEFTMDELDFQLTMPYPESQMNPELVDSQKDLLDLATSIVDTLRDKIIGDAEGVELPDELVTQVFTQILPYDQKRIKDWIGLLKKAKKDATEQQAEEEGDMGGGGFGNPQTRLPKGAPVETGELENLTFESVTKGVSKRVIKEAMEEAIFECTQKKMRNIVIKNRHIFSSRNKSFDYDVKRFVEFKRDQMKKLVEEVQVGTLIEESIADGIPISTGEA